MIARSPEAGSLAKTTCSCSAPSSKTSTGVLGMGTTPVAGPRGGWRCGRDAGVARPWCQRSRGRPRPGADLPAGTTPVRRVRRGRRRAPRAPASISRASASYAAARPVEPPGAALLLELRGRQPDAGQAEVEGAALELVGGRAQVLGVRRVDRGADRGEVVRGVGDEVARAALEQADALLDHLVEHVEPLPVDDVRRPVDPGTRRRRPTASSVVDVARRGGRVGAVDPLVQHPLDPRGVDRLGEEVVHAGLQAPLPLALEGRGGHRDDRHPLAGLLLGPDRPGRGEAVHPRHPAVHQHGGEAVAGGEGGDRLHAVGGDLGVEAGVLEHADGDHLVDVVVLDHEDPLLRGAGRARLPDRTDRAQDVAGGGARTRAVKRNVLPRPGSLSTRDPAAHGARPAGGRWSARARCRRAAGWSRGRPG